jgi:hypothetical protein
VQLLVCVPPPEGLGAGCIGAVVSAPALGAEQGCFEQQLGQHQPLMQLLQSSQCWQGRCLELDALAWHNDL